MVHPRSSSSSGVPPSSAPMPRGEGRAKGGDGGGGGGTGPEAGLAVAVAVVVGGGEGQEGVPPLGGHAADAHAVAGAAGGGGGGRGREKEVRREALEGILDGALGEEVLVDAQGLEGGEAGQHALQPAGVLQHVVVWVWMVGGGVRAGGGGAGVRQAAGLTQVQGAEGRGAGDRVASVVRFRHRILLLWRAAGQEGLEHLFIGCT